MEQIFVALFCLATAVCGMIVHWAKKYVRDEISTTFLDYFFKVEKKASFAAFTTLVGVVFGLFATGSAPMTFAEMNVTQFATYFLAGYSINSAVNKGE